MCVQECVAITRALFIVIFTVYAMSAERSVHEEADRLLEVLVDVNASLGDVEDLFRDHVKSLITSIDGDCASWSVYSAESQVFAACLSRAGVAIARNVDLVLPILERTTGKEADPELRLRHFVLLSDYFANNQNLHRHHHDDTRAFVRTIIEELVIPGLVWTAGRSAEAIRTAAVCCLCVILQSRTIDGRDDEDDGSARDEETTAREIASPASTRESERSRTGSDVATELYPSLRDKAVPILLSLMNDKARKTRLYSMRAVCSIVTLGRRLSRLTDEHVHRAYPAILRRLDDGCDDVRHAAVDALVEVWSAASENYDVVISRSHVDALYTTMIVHLDDPESHFQQIMLGISEILSTGLSFSFSLSFFFLTLL